MTYIPIPISEKTTRIREEYLKMPVPQETNPYVDKKYRHFCTGDRWITLGFLEGYLKHADAPTTRLRRSYAEAAELYAAQPFITDHELLAGHIYLPEYTPEEQKRYDELCDMFIMSASTLAMLGPRNTHLGMDFEKLLKHGILGIRQEILECMEKLNYNDAYVYPNYEVIKKDEFYKCCLLELDAVLDLASRYAQKAKEMALAASEPRKTELLRISQALSKVPAQPAETFFEAIQSVNFFVGTLFGLYPLCRPDRYLYPYYEKDLKEGKLSKEDVQDLIDNFCLGVSTRVFSRAACGFMVGGQDEQGNLIENDLTYMFLTALDHIRMADPNGALSVNSKTSDDILEYAATILSKGVTHPAFYNDDAIISSLMEYGIPRSDAVNYIHTTCAEISVVGKTRGNTTAFYIDLPRLLVETVQQYPDCANFCQLEQYYIDHIKENVQYQPFRYVTRMLEASRNGNDPMRICCLVDNCIASGKGIFEGGERYTFIQPIFVGFANAVDSLAAIQRLVFEDHKFSLQEFCQLIETNFEDQEPLRQYIIHKLPHYGNADEQVDSIAGTLGEAIRQIFKIDDLLAGVHMIPGTFSYMDHARFGQLMGATFDGRASHYAYSDGCSPVQGRDTNGPTSMILSLTSWEQKAFLGGMVVNIKFGKEHLKGTNISRFIQLLRTFIQRGGLEMQVNVVDRQTLLDAQEHPENHSNLLVRIGGFSDYFVRLNPTLQQEIIDRTEY